MYLAQQLVNGAKNLTYLILKKKSKNTQTKSGEKYNTYK